MLREGNGHERSVLVILWHDDLRRIAAPHHDAADVPLHRGQVTAECYFRVLACFFAFLCFGVSLGSLLLLLFA